jgi:hypothetical protein
MAGYGTRSLSRRGGLTLFELVVTIAILLIAVASTSAASISLSAMRQEQRERSIAEDAARSLADRILSIGRAEIGNPGCWARRVTESVCEPNALGTAFDVAGLEPWDGFAHAGSITFVADETRTDAEIGASMGMPRDLDGDGFASGASVLETARLLPAVIEIRWRGIRGEERVLHPFLVVGY